MKKILAFVLIHILIFTIVALAEAVEISYEVGSIFTFGAYEQDNDAINGASN